MKVLRFPAFVVASVLLAQAALAAPRPSPTPAVERPTRSIAIVINGEQLNPDDQPRVVSGRVLLPMRAVFAALGISICFALAFAWVSLWVGMTVRTAGAVQGVMFLLVLPLSFASNAFVQASTMPGWLQAFVNVNPLSHLVSAVRALLLGGPVAAQVGWTFAWIAGLLVVFFPLALRGYIRRT